ncbi:MAG: hypothetical protein AUJ20_08455 [Comamonadaceae bacterium CG1_02_60_18]|nr:MAG: hypothetical protein AUJ20_08455 [Comamonadaceae bacterium CG1_02_60_18]
MLDLAAGQQQQIQHLLSRRLPHVTAVAFGSRVTGWPHGNPPKPYSDLNIALWGMRPTDDIALAHWRTDLEESALPWRVDLSDANSLPATLRDQIEHCGVYLQGRSTAQLAAG